MLKRMGYSNKTYADASEQAIDMEADKVLKDLKH